MGNNRPFSIKRVSWLRSRLTKVPKMTIASHFPWQAKLLFFAIAVGLCALIALWAYDQGRNVAGTPETSREHLQKLEDKIAKLTDERDRLTITADTAQSKLDMLHATQTQLATQVSNLEAENVRLKEDLMFFESLLPADAGGGAGLGIRRLKVEATAPGQLRYRILVMQGGKGAASFIGTVQLGVSGMLDGKNTVLNFPEDKASPADRDKYALSFKHYQRLEGVVNVPEGMVVKAVQARIMEKGRVRAQQSVNL